MKTKAFNFIKKPNYISIHKWNTDKGYYEALQWGIKGYIKDEQLIGVWHIKYKDIDCNFS